MHMTSASNPLHRAFIGLGGNLDSPKSRVQGAFDALGTLPGVRLLACSSLYASSPVGLTEQPDFINAVALIETTLAPQALLNALLDLERAAGRVRLARFGPRTLDIDILLYDDCIIDEPGLSIPHPRMHERAFVLKPLLEIAPEASIPGRGAAREYLAQVMNQHCERLDD